MADQFVTELIYKGVGLDTILKMQKEAGAGQAQLNKLAEDYNRVTKEQADLAIRNNKLLEQRALMLTKAQDALKAGRGSTPETSFAKQLGADPITRDFVRYQSAISRAEAKLGGMTGPEAEAQRVAIARIEEQYGSLGKRIAETAGISRTAFLKDMTPQQYVAVVEAARQLNVEVKKGGDAHQEAGVKTRFNTNQMMQLTAAARNTAESLASGISLQTTLLTQGMQVLGAVVGDSWKLITGLAVTAGVTATALAPLIRAMTLISQERDIDATARAYGNMTVGVRGTAEAMRELADNSKFSRSEMIGAVQELIKLRSVSSDMRGNIMSAAVPFAAATGKSPADAVKELTAAFDGTYEGVRKLDQVYGFLSASQLEQIRIMMKQGDILGANRVAMEAFSKQMEGAAKTGETSWATLWQAISRNVNQNLDNIATHPVMRWLVGGVGNVVKVDNSSDRKLRDAQERLSLMQNIGAASWVIRGAEQDVENLQRGRFRQSGSASAAEAAANARRVQNEETLGKLLTDQTKEYSSQIDVIRAIGVERVKQEALQRGRKAARAAGITDQGQIDSFAAEFAGRDVSVATAQIELDRQTESLRRQADAQRDLAVATRNGARAMSEARAQAAAREAAATGQNAAVARMVSLMNDQSSALAGLNEEARRAAETDQLLQRSRVVGIDQATLEMKLMQSGLEGTKLETAARKALADTIKTQADARRRLNDAESNAAGQRLGLLGPANDNMSASERQYRGAMISARQSFAAGGSVEDLERAVRAANAARAEANAQEGRAIRETLEPRIKLTQELARIEQATGISEAERAVERRRVEREYEDALIRRRELEEDWASGAERGWLKYKQSVGTAADAAEQFTTRAFGHMEDALTDFVMTGKMNFNDLATSIIADLIRIQIRMQMTGMMESVGGFAGIAGMFRGMFDGGGGGEITGSIDPASLEMAHGGAFDQSGVIPFARGGVVNGMTPFRFGRGGALNGIMGEAGPEAIVPLTRTPQGDLGIRSTGGGAQVKVEVIDQRGGNAAPIDVETQMGAFGPIVRIIARDEASKAVAAYSRGGGLNTDLRQTYNIRQPAVSRG